MNLVEKILVQLNERERERGGGEWEAKQDSQIICSSFGHLQQQRFAQQCKKLPKLVQNFAEH